MAKLAGTNVASPILPFSSLDTFPSHIAQYGKGGWRAVNEYDELAEISIFRCEQGMAVYVNKEKVFYILTEFDFETNHRVWEKYQIESAPENNNKFCYKIPANESMDLSHLADSMLCDINYGASNETGIYQVGTLRCVAGKACHINVVESGDNLRAFYFQGFNFVNTTDSVVKISGIVNNLDFDCE